MPPIVHAAPNPTLSLVLQARVSEMNRRKWGARNVTVRAVLIGPPLEN